LLSVIVALYAVLSNWNSDPEIEDECEPGQPEQQVFLQCWVVKFRALLNSGFIVQDEDQSSACGKCGRTVADFASGRYLVRQWRRMKKE
jgi:hypothetical protein